MFFIKSSKLLVLVTTLCVMVTNSSKASNAIEVLDSNNIEHSSNIVERNMESVIIGDNNINESHNNNEVNNNHNNLEHNNNNINQENINNEHNNSYSVNENADQNNNNYVILAVKEEGIQVGNNKEENLCNSVTKLFKGVITIPILLGSYAISTSNFNVQNGDSYSNIAINNLRNGSKEVLWISFGNTVKEFQNTTRKILEHITNFGSGIITVGGTIKSYFNRIIFR